MQLRKFSTRTTACAAGPAASVALGVVRQATAAPASADAAGMAVASPKKTGAQPIIGGKETQAQPYHARLFKNGQDHSTATWCRPVTS